MTNKDIELERTALEAAAVHRYDPHFERFLQSLWKDSRLAPRPERGFIRKDTPEWRCWERHLGRSMPDARDGWWFDSRWSRHGVPMSPAAIKAIADRADRTRP